MACGPREALESPQGVQFWGVHREGSGLAVLQQGMEEAICCRNENEEASRRKDKDRPKPEREKIHRELEQVNSPWPEPEGEMTQVDEEPTNYPQLSPSPGAS